VTKTAPTTTLVLERRDHTGTTGANATRREGKIPGVLYGHGSEALAVSVDARALDDLLATGGRSHVLDAQIAGARDTVLLRTVQRHPVTHRPVHADFQRVSRNETISATLPIVTTGVARGVKDLGGVLDIVTHAVEIAGPANAIPDQIDVDVTSLGLRDHITAGNLRLPAGFTLHTPADTIIVSVEPSRVEAEAIADLEATQEVPLVAEASDAPAGESATANES